MSRMQESEVGISDSRSLQTSAFKDKSSQNGLTFGMKFNQKRGSDDTRSEVAFTKAQKVENQSNLNDFLQGLSQKQA